MRTRLSNLWGAIILDRLYRCSTENSLQGSSPNSSVWSTWSQVSGPHGFPKHHSQLFLHPRPSIPTYPAVISQTHTLSVPTHHPLVEDSAFLHPHLHSPPPLGICPPHSWGLGADNHSPGRKVMTRQGALSLPQWQGPPSASPSFLGQAWMLLL